MIIFLQNIETHFKIVKLITKMLRNISRHLLARHISTRRHVEISRLKKTPSKSKANSEGVFANPIPPVLVKHAVEEVNVNIILFLHI